MLEGLPHWMPASVAMLYPFADALLLLAGRPATLSIWSTGSPEAPVFTTGKASERLGHGLAVDIPKHTGTSPDFVCQLNFAASSSNSPLGECASEEEIRAAFQDALRGSGTDTSKRFLECLHDAINEAKEHAKEHTTVLSASSYVTKPTQSERKRHSNIPGDLMHAVTQVVDQASAPFADSPVHKVKYGDLSVFNLFALTFTGSSNSKGQEHQARLLPTLGFRSMRRHRGTDDTALSFQYLNSQGPRDIITYAQGDSLKSIVGALLSIDGDNEAREILNSFGIRSAFIAPIHIDGFPWIALIRFLRDSPQDWNDAFEFYREVVPRISTHLRSDLQELYVDTVTNAVRSEVEDVLSESRIESINERCRSLSAFFPYEQIVFSPDRQNEQSQQVHTFPNKSVWISSVANPYFAKSIEYEDRKSVV